MIDLGEDGWIIFEAYTRASMATSTPQKLDCRPCVGKNKTSLYNTTNPLVMGGCKETRVVPDIVKAAKETCNVLFHSVTRSNKLVDFLYQDENGAFHAFQVTIGKKHSANVGHIKELVGLVQDGNTSIQLSLYYLVPWYEVR